MANLALVEESFFETPPDVSDELARLTWARLPTAGRIDVVDACAGDGALSRSFLAAAPATARVRLGLVENNAVRLRRCVHNLPANIDWQATSDLFHEKAGSLVRNADIVLMNPPFAGVRGKSMSASLADFQKHTSYPDIGCHYILQIVKKMKPGAVLGLVFRRNAFVSRAYREFRRDFAELGTIEKFVDVGRRLRPGSGAAESALIIYRARKRDDNCWLKQQEITEAAREGSLLIGGWRSLSHIAKVRAGPSVRNEQKELLGGDSALVRVVEVPPVHNGSRLWGPGFFYRMHWAPAAFSVPRNLSSQGCAGFVYKLAASEFRTAILPSGYHFLSSTPAVLPRRPYDLNFITGCALLPSWRSLVRQWVPSSNFTPGAIEEVYVPYSSFALYRLISSIGFQARSEIARQVRMLNPENSRISSNLASRIKHVDAVMEAELDSFMCDTT